MCWASMVENRTMLRGMMILHFETMVNPFLESVQTPSTVSSIPSSNKSEAKEDDTLMYSVFAWRFQSKLLIRLLTETQQSCDKTKI